MCIRDSFCSSKGDKVISTVEPSGTVHAETAVREFFGRIREVFASFKNQMLEQMSHTGFAVVFLTRADQVSHVNGRRIFRGIREKNHACLLYTSFEVLPNQRGFRVTISSKGVSSVITSRALILCAGGFANNPELIRRYLSLIHI